VNAHLALVLVALRYAALSLYDALLRPLAHALDALSLW